MLPLEFSEKRNEIFFYYFEGLRCTWMGLLISFFFSLAGGNGKRDVNEPYPLIYKAVLFIPQEISLSFLFGRRKNLRC